MTRAQSPGADLEYRSFGAPGATRTVFVLREGATATADPNPSITSRHDVRVVAVVLDRHEVDDPGAYGGQTPADETVAGLADFIDEQLEPGETPAVVGVGGAGPVAIMLAVRLGDELDRLALVAVPKPVSRLAADEATEAMARVSAATLVLNGRTDSQAGAEAAAWHEENLPSAVVVLTAETSVVGGLSLDAVWDHVLAHVAPGSRRDA